MKGVEYLEQIEDTEVRENIREITRVFVDKIKPLKVILFGSFAKGSYTDDSDFDFYLVVEDGRNIVGTTQDAYRATAFVKKRPVDIVVGSDSRFELKRFAAYSQMIEREVEDHGILLYDLSEV